MQAAIRAAGAEGDSVGGMLETVITGVPAGIGEPFFDSVESEIAHLAFAIPAVKGIEFGAGFAFADLRGSQANDPFTMRDGKVVTATNNNGGHQRRHRQRHAHCVPHGGKAHPQHL